MSSLSVRFFNSFKSKYLNFFFYLFDCQVSCASSLCRLSLLLHHREMLKQLSLTSPEFGCRDSRLVGLDGLEPSTSRLSGVRSSHLSYRPVFPLRFFSSSISLLLLSSPLQFFQTVRRDSEPLTRLRRVVGVLSAIQLQQFRSTAMPLIEIGGDEGIRTLDPLLAGQVLSQLSYTPILLGLCPQDS